MITVVFLDDQSHPTRFLESLNSSVSCQLDNLAFDVAWLRSLLLLDDLSAFADFESALASNRKNLARDFRWQHHDICPLSALSDVLLELDR